MQQAPLHSTANSNSSPLIQQGKEIEQAVALQVRPIHLQTQLTHHRQWQVGEHLHISLKQLVGSTQMQPHGLLHSIRQLVRHFVLFQKTFQDPRFLILFARPHLDTNQNRSESRFQQAAVEEAEHQEHNVGNALHRVGRDKLNGAQRQMRHCPVKTCEVQVQRIHFSVLIDVVSDEDLRLQPTQPSIATFSIPNCVVATTDNMAREKRQGKEPRDPNDGTDLSRRVLVEPILNNSHKTQYPQHPSEAKHSTHLGEAQEPQHSCLSRECQCDSNPVAGHDHNVKSKAPTGMLLKQCPTVHHYSAVVILQPCVEVQQEIDAPEDCGDPHENDHVVIS
mmetsp:Transcript_8373/g.23286  ORF Transcript_8373/g.23286 Transcript_8373/m.23286 type:complete len:335 (-) Transcript_8373:274-1278(-)